MPVLGKLPALGQGEMAGPRAGTVKTLIMNRVGGRSSQFIMGDYSLSELINSLM